MLTLPLAEACWLTRRPLLLPPLLLATPLGVRPNSSSASARFRFPRKERAPAALEEVARETVMRDGGLGDSLSLAGKQAGATSSSSSWRAEPRLGPPALLPHPPKGLLPGGGLGAPTSPPPLPAASGRR